MSLSHPHRAIALSRSNARSWSAFQRTWACMLCLFVASTTAWLGSGCASKKRVRALETRLAAVEQALGSVQEDLSSQSLRSESVAVGLEKICSRVDQITPASAQWLEFTEGAIIKWYADEEAQNVYVQYLNWDPDERVLEVTVTTQAGASRRTLRTGEAIEHVWDAPSSARHLIITFHRTIYPEGGTPYGLFSFMEGPLDGI